MFKNGRLHEMGTKAKIAAVKKSGWADFSKQFPNADKDKFFAQTSDDDKWNVTAEMFFNEGSGLH